MTSQDDDFDPRDFLPYLLNRAADASSLEFQAIYKARYGMLRTEWRVLFHLGLFGGMTAKEIGARAGIHKTKISRAVARLERRRFLSRTRDRRDRRRETLALTGAGRAAYDDLRDIARDYDAALVGDLGTEEADRLRAMLRQLTRGRS